jgi:dethiobiotin synthetase
MRIVVVGTGTDVGKTHVSSSLLSFARSEGRRGAAFKPIATGVTASCDDAVAHAEALAVPYRAPAFSYLRPVSPHLAAREEKRPIDLPLIARETRTLEEGYEFVLVEIAGGLFSPLSETKTNADLVLALAPAAVVLVAPDRLGVLHDVGACVRAARASGIELSARVLSAPVDADASTGSNAEELDRVGLGPVTCVFPRARADAPESRSAAARLWRLLV